MCDRRKAEFPFPVFDPWGSHGAAWRMTEAAEGALWVSLKIHAVASLTDICVDSLMSQYGWNLAPQLALRQAPLSLHVTPRDAYNPTLAGP